MSASKFPEGLKKEVLGEFLRVFKAVGNETRLEILCSLCDGCKTWTQFVYDSCINPKSVRDHLRVLQEAKLIRKHEPHGFELTDFGVSVLEFLVGFVKNVSKKRLKAK